MMKKIAILGSTGSIGKQTLDVAREQKDIEVTALCARKSVDLMEAQIREFRPKTAVMFDEDAAKDLRIRVKDLDVTVLAGMDGILEVASMEGYEYFVTAIMGMVGVRPTVAAISLWPTKRRWSQRATSSCRWLQRRVFRSSPWTASTVRSSSP